MPKLKNNSVPDREPAAPASLPEEIRESLRATLKANGRSVDQLAEALTARLGVRVTANAIYDFTAESHPHRFPMEWMAAWIRETGDFSLLWVITDALGLPRHDKNDAELLAFAKARLAAELAEQEAEGLKARILRPEGL